MVNEVNKLIFNTLLDKGAVYIPEIGTIRIERTAARKMFRGRVAPYTLGVSFTTSCEAMSLVDAIISIACVSTDDAEDIVRRWLKKSTDNGRVVITDVGVIQNGVFTADQELTKVLDSGNRVVVITRNSGSKSFSWVATIIVALCLFGGIAAYFTLSDNADSKADTTITSSNNVADNTTQPDADTDTETTPIMDSVEIVSQSNIAATNDLTSNDETVVAEQTIATDDTSTHETKEVETADIVAGNNDENVESAATIAQDSTQNSSEEVIVADWRNMSVRHYVIFGSYSVPSNANAAIRKIMRKNPAAQCKIIKLGNMHAVAVYGSYSRRDCEIFKRNHRSLYRDSWIHTPKRFK